MEQLLLLVLFIVGGYALAYTKLARPQDYKVMANFVFYVCLPASILASFSGVSISTPLYSALLVLAGSFAFSVAASWAVSAALGLERKVFYILLICGFFGNIVFFGFPFIEMFYGDASLPLAGIFVSIYNLFIFALLYPLISMRLGSGGGMGWRKIITNPVIIATLAGIAVLLAALDISAIVPYLKGFSSMTTPLSLVAMGLFLAGHAGISLDRNVFAITAVKCFLFPLATFGLLAFAGQGEGAKEMLMLSLMPVAISNFIIADSLDLGLDKLVMDAIVVTTLVSTVLVFALAWGGVL